MDVWLIQEPVLAMTEEELETAAGLWELHKHEINPRRDDVNYEV